jgi:hypothetical protein
MAASPFFCAPGRAHGLEGESPLLAQEGEQLAGGKDVRREAESEGSPRQNVGLTNRNPLCSSRKEKRPFTQKFLQSQDELISHPTRCVYRMFC